METKNIAKSYKLAKRIDYLPRSEIFITLKELTKSLIDNDDHKIRTIKHCRKYLLFHNNLAWKIKTTRSCFDVTIDSYDCTDVANQQAHLFYENCETSLTKRIQFFTVTTD